MRIAFSKRAKIVALALLPVALAGCGTTSKFSRASLTSRECMARVMYFESNRSSDEGMLAVGTVVMNRMQSGRYPRTVCGVIGQPNQFAPGVLTKPMTDGGRPRAFRMADAVLGGARHQGVGSRAMFFHTAGYKFPYNNMNYLVIAGGNSFYEKRRPEPGVMLARQEDVAARQQLAWMGERRQPQPIGSFSEPVERRMASYETRPARRTRVAAIPIYEEPREVRVADARPAPYGYDAGRDRFEPRPARIAQNRDTDAYGPGSYGYVERSARRPSSSDEGYEPAPQRVAQADYDEPQILRAPQERTERRVQQPIQTAEWGDAPAQPRRRTIDPSEPMVLASVAPVRRERVTVQAPRSIDQLIDEPAEAPRPRRGAAPRNLAAPEFAGQPVFVPDR